MSEGKIKTMDEKGVKVLHNPIWNKGTAFTAEEREKLGLRGLLPPNIQTQDQQVKRVMEAFRAKPNDLERYIYLISLQDRNEHLFYRVVTEHLEELVPIIYTPTVGRACQSFGHIYRRPRGLYISSEDRGRVRAILENWPHRDVRVIVVTDGERILGLGDLGADGMGIPIGKLSLYTACAGIHPASCLPVTLDVGTNNERLLGDPLYLGMHHPRVRGEEYDALIEEFIRAVEDAFPGVLIQLEDFATGNAFRLTQKYRGEHCLFNDDIQGTASVALAGILSSLRISGTTIEEQRLLILGAGEAGTGIAGIVTAALTDRGMPEAEARRHCWLVDSKGLVCAGRDDLAPHKRKFAHDHPFLPTFREALEELQPTAIVGVCGQPGKFDREVIEKMAELNEHPVIFALSNPTSKSECTAEEAYAWSGGRAVFASGSPFRPVEHNGRWIVPGQGNNVYIFPGIGLGVSFCRARIVTDRMFLEASRVLAECVNREELDSGSVYPSLTRIREVSARIAVAVVRSAIQDGLTDYADHGCLEADIREAMFDPDYPDFS